MTPVDLPAGTLLGALGRAGVLTPVDVGVADTVGRLTGEAHPDVLAAVALAARAPRHGHVCVELDQIADRVGDDADSQVTWPDLDDWVARLQASQATRGADDGTVRPVVLDGHRLYLDRYWRYQQRLFHRLQAMAATSRDDTDTGEVRGWLDRLFGPPDDGEPDRQRLAAALATIRSLTVISGGPGTGKTTTIVRILALLLATVRPRDPGRSLRVALAAPTGKAAARMQEAVREAVDGLDVDDALRARLVAVPASTLHRLLGWRRDNSTRFRHDADEPLPYDVIVVDEASMVSLSLMAKLLDAVPRHGRLLLVGDREQLVSVEAGSVLGDICGPVRPGPGSLRLSSTVADAVTARTGQPLDDAVTGIDEGGIGNSIVQLERFYRFGPETGIGSVARAIQRVDDSADEVMALLRGDATEQPGIAAYHDVELVAPADATVPSAVRDAIVAGYRPYLDGVMAGADPGDLLARFDDQRVLAALRRGPHGVAVLNAAIERWLAQAVDGFEPDRGYYLGRPVIVTRNDYSVGLYNGDVGIVVRAPHDPGQRTVAFPAPDGGVRHVGPSRLPPHETVFAMTVHKSQGSQFGRVVLVLPTVDVRILTRELVYTGVTRAKDHVTVVADQDVLRGALLRPVQRASGLADELWAASTS